MVTPITVVIPVGPRAEDCAFLGECLESVMAQTVRPRLIVIDDMHGIDPTRDGNHDHELPWADFANGTDYPIVFHSNEWNLGVAASFNTGVAIAPTEHVLLLGADDWLDPTAIECAQHAIETQPSERGYYWFRVRYSDDRPLRDQSVPCGAAVVTKALWRATGGFPVESAVGRSDSMLVGLLMKYPELGDLIPIPDNSIPPYRYRVHDASHTASRGPWVQALESTAQAYWSTWAKPAWGRYE